jgi:glycosyltransferase involved in cell wall biosynthesis
MSDIYPASPGRWRRDPGPWSRTAPRADDTPAPASPAPAPTPPPRIETTESRRILLVNQYYWPDHASTAQHLTDLAESLAAAGHDVHVLCSRGGYKPGQKPLPRCEERHGVTIHRVGATALGRRSTWTRMTDYLSFHARATLRALALPRCDVVVTLTTPPLIGLVGTLLKAWRGARHVCWSMDLHPDASIALGRMSPRNPAVRILQRLGDHAMRAADRVVVLGSYMADRVLAKQVRPTRIATIPVWSRKEEITPLPRAGHPLRASLGLGDAFVAMYSGNLGLAHSFEEFLEAARRLRDRRDIVFLFVGGGPRLAEVRRAQEAEPLPNLRILDYVPRADLGASLSLADVHLISLRPEMTGIVVPSKLYGAMAAARPVLFVGPDHCEAADTIRRAGCGLTVRPGDASGLVEALEQLAANPAMARGMGVLGRRVFESDFERETCCAAWCGLIEAVAATASASAGALAPLAPATARVIPVPGRVQLPDRRILAGTRSS